MQKKHYYFTLIMFTLLLSFSLNAMAFFGEKTEAEKQKEIQAEKDELHNMARETLDKLYKMQPGAKKTISDSAGYAVFSNFGTKILFVGGGSGKGIVFDNKTKKQTYMKMIEAQAGLGFGIKKFRLVWVFQKHKDMYDFISSGWEFGAQTSVSAQLGEEGGGFAGAISVSPGIWLYQLTDDGLAFELTGKGTKYYKDDDLN